MRKVFMVGSTFVLSLSLFIPSLVNANNDLDGNQFKYDMNVLIEKKIMSGYDDGTYRPNFDITRAEFTRLLVEALELDGGENSESLDFKDVNSINPKWYYPWVVKASSYGLVEGYPEDNTFRPDNNITRQEMAVMIKRGLDLKGVNSDKAPLKFADNSSIKEWAKTDVQHLISLEIIAGTKKVDGLFFAPLENATRGQTAAFINRMLNVIDTKVVTTSTHYNYSFQKMVDAQVKGTPKVDGAGHYTASQKLVEYYVNPNNFSKNSSEYLQFLILSERAGVNSKEINEKALKGKGILAGQGAAFIEAGKQFNINEVYLIAHALHETGNGTSQLAKGIDVGVDANGKVLMVTSQNKDSLKNIKTTYNMFGVKATDSATLSGGSEHAYNQGWFTPAEAIIGGTGFIVTYIKRGQDTLYKMKWNPISPGYPQYATHVSWAVLQTKRMQDMYDLLDNYVQKFDVPTFNNQPGPTKLPTGVAQYNVDTKLAGEKGIVKLTDKNTPLNFREGPTTSFESMSKLSDGTEVTLIGSNGGWYKVKVGNEEGWVSADYVELAKDVKVSSIQTIDQEHVEDVIGETIVEYTLVRSMPVLEDDNVIEELRNGTEVVILADEDSWYHIRIGEQNGWVAKDTIQLTDAN